MLQEVQSPAAQTPCPEHVDAVQIAPGATNTTDTAPRSAPCPTYVLDVPTAHTSVVDAPAVMMPSAPTPVVHGRENESVVVPPACVSVPDVKPAEDTVAPAFVPAAGLCSFWTSGEPGSPTTGRAGYMYGAATADDTARPSQPLPAYENVNAMALSVADHTRLHPGQEGPNATALPLGGGATHAADAGPLVDPDGHAAQLAFTPPAEYVLLPHGPQPPPLPPYPLMHVLHEPPL